MSGQATTASAPAPHDIVEILDARVNRQVSAIVENIEHGRYLLRFDRLTSLPDEVMVRWYDGDAAWQAPSRINPLDGTSATCELAPKTEWQPAPPQTSTRVPVDMSPVLIRIVQSNDLRPGHRVHAICLETSPSGCRASWPGRTPRIDDTVEITFDPTHSDPHSAVIWIPARISEVIPRSFGGTQIDLEFRSTNHTQAARVRAWHQTWQQEHRRRTTA
jgi:hypothetical protein